MLIVFIVQFMMEGLWRTIWLPSMIAVGMLFVTPMLLFANKMPPQVQRVCPFSGGY